MNGADGELLALWRLQQEALNECRDNPAQAAYWIGCVEEFIQMTESEAIRAHSHRLLRRLSVVRLQATRQCAS